MDGEVDGRSRAEVSIIHVAAKHIRSTARYASHAGRRGYSHYAPEWPNRNNDSVTIVDRFLRKIDEQHLVFGVGKIFGQKAAIRRKALGADGKTHIDRPDLYLDHVARSRTIGIDRS